MTNVEEAIGDAATKIAKDIDATCIISIEKLPSKGSPEEINPYQVDVKVTFFRKLRQGVYKKSEYKSTIRRPNQTSVTPIKELLMEGINKKYINKGDRVVCVEDDSLGSGYKGLLFVFDVDKLFFDISTHKLAEHIPSDVIESVLDIAMELAREGREGKKIGTAFIIGEKEEITPYLKQLIINPFSGYSPEERMITNPNIRETVKGFSQLDGVFVIDSSGSIHTSAAYLDIPTKDISMKGFGTRHRVCAAITKEVPCIAISVSESGGTIRVFKEGNIVMRI